MGFNLSVYPNQPDDSNKQTIHRECHHFNSRSFYNFVNSGEMYGDSSILFRSGKYYGLDLSPLLKLVYTWEEVPDSYVKSNIQKTGFLLNLIQTFYNKIKEDVNVCDNIEYVWYEKPIEFTEQQKQELIKTLGATAHAIFESFEEKKSEILRNPNP